MTERNSPWFAAGITDGAADALRSPRTRRGFDPARARSWMYRRGFARGFLAVRRADPELLAQIQARLDAIWNAIDIPDPRTRP